jgi:hypothetical protein
LAQELPPSGSAAKCDLWCLEAELSDAASLSVPLLKAYGFNPLQLLFACISKMRNVIDGVRQSDSLGGDSSSTRARQAGSSETDALLFNPLDDPGD